MLSPKGMLNISIFFVILLGSVAGLRWYDGYQQAKQEDPEVTFQEYVKTDVQDIKKGLGEVGNIVQDARESGDQIKRAQVDKIAALLDIYAEQEGSYPKSLSDLVGVYVDEKSKITEIPTLYYQRRFSGFELSITLSTGEVYKIKR